MNIGERSKMTEQISRRGLLKAGGSAAALALAGCTGGSGESDSRIQAEEMGEWMENHPDFTYAELAENSAQSHVEGYNEDMKASGTHVDSAPERDPVDNPIVDGGSVELTFTAVESDTPAERYSAELRLQTDSDSVFSDFGNFEDQEDLYKDRVAQLFGTVMMPTVGTLFTDSHGPDYRASQTDADSKAVEGIDYVLEDNAGNEEVLSYDMDGVDNLSQTYDEATNEVEAFYQEALEEL